MFPRNCVDDEVVELLRTRIKVSVFRDTNDWRLCVQNRRFCEFLDEWDKQYGNPTRYIIGIPDETEDNDTGA